MKLGTRPERQGRNLQRWACAKPAQASPRPIGDRAKLHHRSECDSKTLQARREIRENCITLGLFYHHIYRCFCLSGFASPALHQILFLFPPLLMSMFTVAEEHQVSIKVNPTEQRHVFVLFVTQNLSDQEQAQQQTAFPTWNLGCSLPDCLVGRSLSSSRGSSVRVSCVRGTRAFHLTWSLPQGTAVSCTRSPLTSTCALQLRARALWRCASSVLIVRRFFSRSAFITKCVAKLLSESCCRTMLAVIVEHTVSPFIFYNTFELFDIGLHGTAEVEPHQLKQDRCWTASQFLVPTRYHCVPSAWPLSDTH